jgi:hypothetical protein
VSPSTTYVVIGLDFGTSCSKAVVRAPYIVSGGKSWAVYFGRYGHPSNRFLLPSKIIIAENGSASLSDPQSEASAFIVGKEFLLTEPDALVSPLNGSAAHAKAIELSAVFVALALREVRKWFLDNHRQEFNGNRISWQFNLGVPSRGFDDHSIRSLFQQIARASWMLADQQGNITLDNAKSALEKSALESLPLSIPLEDINVVPEVIAEFVGYALSDRRRDGLHVIADVGANTFDICAFNLHVRDAELRYPFLSAIVETHGVFRLHGHRLNVLQKWFSEHLSGMARIEDPAAAIPTDIKYYLPQQVVLDKVCDKEMESEFLKKCTLQFTQTIHWMLKRDPESRSWSLGIPCYFGGGGSAAPLYRMALHKANEWISFHTKRKHMKLSTIEKPANLIAKNLEESEYHRLGVASGLSYPARNIGEITSSFNATIIESDHISRYDMAEYVSKDQV